jgi:hypothetical protein
VPKYREGQQERAEVGAGNIIKRLRGRILIMDDETYVPLDPRDVHGRQFYHTDDKNVVPDADRFKGVAKFPKRYMIWQCVDSCGNVSKPYVCLGTMTWKTYLEQCLRKRLLPFIRRYHKDKRVLFWPDMATCHYAKEVQEFLNRHRIPYVLRGENAPNVPQARPIERFWLLCKREYRKRSEMATSSHAMTCIWSRLSREVGKKRLKKLMKGVRQKLRQIRDHGVYEPLKH